MITLYHGSTVEVRKPLVDVGRQNTEGAGYKQDVGRQYDKCDT